MKPTIRVLLARCGTFVAAAAWTLTLFAAKPELVFGTSNVEARGITKGGTAIWFIGSVEPFNGTVLLSHTTRLTVDEDRDRNVTLELPMKPFSAVFVVDAVTGEYAGARPDGSKIPILEDRSLGLAWTRDAQYLDFRLGDAYVFLLRPGVGAWTIRASQGSHGDLDGQYNANLRVALSRMKGVWGAAEAPSTALAKDLLIVMDTHRLTAFARLAKEKE